MASQQISTGSIPTKPPVIIPNVFAAPDFLLDVKQEGSTDADGSDEAAGSTTAGADSTDTAVSYDINLTQVDTDAVTVSSPALLNPPTNISVFSQTVRFTSDGRAVVDVLLDIDDVPGALTYDVRVTK